LDAVEWQREFFSESLKILDVIHFTASPGLGEDGNAINNRVLMQTTFQFLLLSIRSGSFSVINFAIRAARGEAQNPHLIFMARCFFSVRVCPPCSTSVLLDVITNRCSSTHQTPIICYQIFAAIRNGGREKENPYQPRRKINKSNLI
jgi:hypothetical protein